MNTHRSYTAFTIIELLVVIIIIGILVGITTLSYVGISNQARKAKMQSDISQIIQAITLARNSTQKTLGQINGGNYTGNWWSCLNKSSGTDFAGMARTDPCWSVYLSELSAISSASGMNVNNVVDPWGRPYIIDPNEGEGNNGNCLHDSVVAVSQPYVQNAKNSATPPNNVPLSGYQGCNV